MKSFLYTLGRVVHHPTTGTKPTAMPGSIRMKAKRLNWFGTFIWLAGWGSSAPVGTTRFCSLPSAGLDWPKRLYKREAVLTRLYFSGGKLIKQNFRSVSGIDSLIPVVTVHCSRLGKVRNRLMKRWARAGDLWHPESILIECEIVSVFWVNTGGFVGGAVIVSWVGDMVFSRLQ